MSVFKTANMEYRRLGGTGLKVSLLSFGNMVNFKPETAEVDDELILKCLQNGINYFDTAEMYAFGQAQKALGRAIKKSGVDRTDIVVSTKIFNIGTQINGKNNTNRKHVIEGVNACLQRLQLEYVDIIFAHSFDPDTSLEETCRAFNQVIEQGKAFYWATSAWDAQWIFEAFAGQDCIDLWLNNANTIYLKQFEVEYETLFDQYNYGTTVWSPLAGGYLTGKYLDEIPQVSRVGSPNYFGKQVMKSFFYNPYHNEKNIKNLRELQEYAKSLGYTLPQLAIAWVLKNKNVSTALLGARTFQQLEQNLKAFELYKKWDQKIESTVNKIIDTTPTPKFDYKKWTPGVPRRP